MWCGADISTCHYPRHRPPIADRERFGAEIVRQRRRRFLGGGAATRITSVDRHRTSHRSSLSRTGARNDKSASSLIGIFVPPRAQDVIRARRGVCRDLADLLGTASAGVLDDQLGDLGSKRRGRRSLGDRCRAALRCSPMTRRRRVSRAWTGPWQSSDGPTRTGPHLRDPRVQGELSCRYATSLPSRPRGQVAGGEPVAHPIVVATLSALDTGS